MSLIAHYRLDGNADDALGQLNGVPSSGVSWIDGKLGQGGEFNGVNGTIYLGAGADLFPLPSFSVSVWFKSFGTTPNTGTTPGILGLTYGIRLFVYPDLIQFGLDDGSTFVYLNSPASYDFYNDNLWHHVVISATPTSMHLFVDGEAVANRATTWKGSTRWPTDNLIIGKDNNNYPYHFTGLLDDIRIYDHALSKHEVKDLAKGLVFHLEANETGPKDKSLQGNTVVNNGAAYVENVPVGKGGYQLTAGNRIDCTGISLPQTITVESWGMMTDNGPSQMLFSCDTAVGSGPDLFFYGGSIFWNTGDGAANRFVGVAYPSLDVFHHYVVVNDQVANRTDLYIDGAWAGQASYRSSAQVSRRVVVGNYDSDSNYAWRGVIGNTKVYTTALTADDIKELYQRRASLDAQGNFYAGLINDTGIKQPLLLDYTQWEAGQTGNVGMFPRNGDIPENHRVVDTDPWGKPTVVWEARPDATSGPDGGWNADFVPVDPTKTYRFSTWVRRTVIGNGTFYMGCHGSPAVLNRSNGVANGNPYFDYRGGLGATWILVVGHIWPIGSGAGAVHPDSGVYTVTDGRISNVGGNTGGDCVFAEGTTAARHRSYLYYSTDVNTRQQWCYPRMDVCDGTEPSIAELLAGFDSRNEALFRAKSGAMPGQSIASSASGSYSEIGITDGLVAYYPLTKDAKDYSGNGYDGVVNGAVPVGGGFDGKGAYLFNGSTTYIDLPDTVGYTTSLTAMAWFKSKGVPGSGYHIIMGDSALEISIPTSGDLRTGVVTSARYVSNHGSGLLDGNWHHVGVTYANGVKNSFIDGVKVGELTGIAGDLVQTIANRRLGVFGAQTSYYANGEICNVKIFNRALSPEEIAVEYKRTGPAKMTQYNGRTYIQGQFKEVTA